MSKKEQTTIELLDTFNRARTRKQSIAEKAGFNDIEKYKEYLEMKIKIEELGGSEPKEQELIIEHIAVLDCSGSMSGQSIKNAKEGLKEDFSAIQRSDIYKLIPFGSKVGQTTVVSAKDNFDVFGATMGMTALHDATSIAIDLALESKNKCLIKVFTDGGENVSHISVHTLKDKISEAKKKDITVTFIGLQSTINNLVDRLGVSRSNTLTYDGSPEDMKKSFSKMKTSTRSYATKALAGENVTEGFYKDLN